MKTLMLTAICCSTILLPQITRAQERHADYVVLGKSINHRQAADGSLQFLNTVFFAEIFATEGGSVSNGFLEGPGDAYVIPAGSLPIGEPVQLEVEHSNMETDIWQGMEIIVTYAATSFLDIHTSGNSTRNPRCPAVPYAMDGGQTDRERLK